MQITRAPAYRPDRRQAAIHQLALAAATAEAVAALRGSGVRAILIKGPTIAGWLYDDPSDRPYCDIDLVVEAGDFVAAEAVLAGLGYESRLLGLRAVETVSYERPWVRTGGRRAIIDLHRSLSWETIDPGAAWSVLSEGTDLIDLCGTSVEVPGAAQRTLLLALHAAGDGPQNPKPLADLDLALARLDEPLWRAAAAMADRLQASEPFAAGLRLRPDGVALAERLDLAPVASVEVRLRAGGAPVTALGFERLRARSSTTSRARFLVGELFPSPAFIRAWRPLASRGTLGLLAVYLWRPLWLAWMAPRGAWAWSRTRRDAQRVACRQP